MEATVERDLLEREMLQHRAARMVTAPVDQVEDYEEEEHEVPGFFLHVASDDEARFTFFRLPDDAATQSSLASNPPVCSHAPTNRTQATRRTQLLQIEGAIFGRKHF